MRLFFKIIKLLICAAALLAVIILIPSYIASDISGNAKEAGVSSKSTSSGDLTRSCHKYQYLKPHVEKTKSNDNNDLPSQPDNKISGISDYLFTRQDLMALNDLGTIDKIKGLSIFSKLKESDMEKILDIVNNEGITVDRFNEIKDILEKDLSQQDIKCLDEIVKKNFGIDIK